MNRHASGVFPRPTRLHDPPRPCRSGGSRELGGRGGDGRRALGRRIRACRRSYMNRRASGAFPRPTRLYDPPRPCRSGGSRELGGRGGDGRRALGRRLRACRRSYMNRHASGVFPRPTRLHDPPRPCRSGGSRELGGRGCDGRRALGRRVRACRRSYMNRRASGVFPRPTRLHGPPRPCRSGGSRELGGRGGDGRRALGRRIRACRRSYMNRRACGAFPCPTRLHGPPRPCRSGGSRELGGRSTAGILAAAMPPIPALAGWPPRVPGRGAGSRAGGRWRGRAPHGRSPRSRRG